MEYILRSHVSRTVAAAGNYDAADIVSDSASNGVGTAWQFPNLAFADGRPGTIYAGLVKCSEDSVVWRLRLHLFTAEPSTATEKDDTAAKAMDNDDRDIYLGYIDFPAMADMGEFSAAQTNCDFGYICADGSHTLYGLVETLDAETNETAGMTMDFTLYARVA